MSTRNTMFKQVTLSIPQSVYERAAFLARVRGCTLEEVLVTSIALEAAAPPSPYPNIVRLTTPHQRVEVDFVTTREQTIQTSEGSQVNISKNQRFRGNLIVWHNDKDLFEKHRRDYNDLEGGIGMISIHAHLTSNEKSYQYRGYLEYHDLHFHDGEHVSKTAQMDFCNCPTLEWVVDSRDFVCLFIDGEKILVHEKYMAAFLTFTIDIRNVFVKCTFYDPKLSDCRTVYYKRKISDILFLPTFTVEYEKGKIAYIEREADNPVDLAVY